MFICPEGRLLKWYASKMERHPIHLQGFLSAVVVTAVVAVRIADSVDYYNRLAADCFAVLVGGVVRLAG